MPEFITLSDVYENIVNGKEKPSFPEQSTEIIQEGFRSPSPPTIRWRGGNSECRVDVSILSSQLEDSDNYEEVMESVINKKDTMPLKELIIQTFNETKELSFDGKFGMDLFIDFSALTFDDHVTFYRTTLEGLVDDYVEKKREEKELEEYEDDSIV